MELKRWIERYYRQTDVDAVMTIIREYGAKPHHREMERVWRDCIIISKGSFEILKATVTLADIDYRDVLVSEEVDPWVIHELKTIRKFETGYDHQGMADRIMRQLEAEGQIAWKEKLDIAITGGATGTECLLRLSSALQEMLKKGKNINPEIQSMAKKLIQEIGKTLRV